MMKIMAAIFFLYKRVMFVTLMVGCVISMANQYFGPVIRCGSDPEIEINTQFFEAFCWATSTYTSFISKYQENEPRMYLKYYSYVNVVLLLQAILLYLPYAFWKFYYDKYFKSFYDHVFHIINDYNVYNVEKERLKSATEGVAKMLVVNASMNRNFALSYIFKEFFVLANVIFHFLLLDNLLDGHFFSLGINFLDHSLRKSNDTFVVDLFPQVTMCSFEKFEESGHKISIDGYCVLPMNEMNSYIFTVNWFLIVLYIILSFLNFVYFFLCWVLPAHRATFSYLPGTINNELKAFGEDIGKLSYGEWLVISRFENSLMEWNSSQMLYQITSIIATEQKDILKTQRLKRLFLRGNKAKKVVLSGPPVVLPFEEEDTSPEKYHLERELDTQLKLKKLGEDEVDNVSQNEPENNIPVIEIHAQSK